MSSGASAGRGRGMGTCVDDVVRGRVRGRGRGRGRGRRWRWGQVCGVDSMHEYRENLLDVVIRVGEDGMHLDIMYQMTFLSPISI